MGRINCNFDGACEERTKCGGFGVLMRNSNGFFLAVLSGKLGDVTSPLKAELLTARRAVVFVQEFYAGGMDVVFEGDYYDTGRYGTTTG